MSNRDLPVHEAEDIMVHVAQSGIPVMDVEGGLAELVDLGLVKRVLGVDGSVGYQISLEPLKRLFCYVAPRLPKARGGIWDATEDELRGGFEWYAGQVMSWEELRPLWEARPEQPEEPDPAVVERLVGVDEEADTEAGV